ncbi:hypothetical protein N5U20_06650 [Aliarcobacter butzleri]|nr:hypothetical protein [Aliarcobacter butzleri]MCT7563995.1 hypothetical protein [Aliarcobacter butzleri]MCT7612891.1 hypothetical protein [Aliarcobacter butzleri]MCT7641527.1 hypothetical protein [Aliarcobacter butzleri]
MILSLSAKDREALILGIVGELKSESLALCHFFKIKSFNLSNILLEV